METGAVLAWQPAQTLKATLPELMISVRGWRRARGLDPDSPPRTQAMTPSELQTLIEKYG